MITPVKFWCQKVLPLVYDDSLSYYELLCKLTSKINEMVNAINTLPSNWLEMVQQTLNEWIMDGTMSKIIDTTIFPDYQKSLFNLQQYISTVSNNVVHHNQPESITMDMLSQNVKEALTGGSTPVVGDKAINNININDNAVNERTIVAYETSPYQFPKNESYLNINTKTGMLEVPSEFIIMNGSSPTVLKQGNYPLPPLPFTQLYYFCANTEGDIIFHPAGSTVQPTEFVLGLFAYLGEITTWYRGQFKVDFKINGNFLPDVEYYPESPIFVGTPPATLLMQERKLTPPTTIYEASSGGISVKDIPKKTLDLDPDGQWLWFDKSAKTFSANINIPSKGVTPYGYCNFNLGIYRSQILTTLFSTGWAIVGDSITEINPWWVSVAMMNAKKPYPYAKSGRAFGNTSAVTDGKMFIDVLKEVDPDVLELTLWGGVNDYRFNTPLGSKSNPASNTFYYKVKECVDYMQTTRPKVNCVFCTPIPCVNELTPNSVGATLPDYINVMMEIFRENHMQCVDLYTVSGINVNNPSFVEEIMPDGVHPNLYGLEKIYHHIASAQFGCGVKIGGA